ncbi:MAG: GlmU family protein [Schleiferiaceae bacterium]
MNLILFDGPQRDHLLPFTFTRPVADLRLGILTIAEKWERRLETKPSFYTPGYLRDCFKPKIQEDNVMVNGGLTPNLRLLSKIVELKMGQGLFAGEELLSCRISGEQVVDFPDIELERVEFEADFTMVRKPWDLFLLNKAELKKDFELVTGGRTSAPISSTNTVMGDQIFLEEGAYVEASILNATDAPIYIGKNAQVLEGAMIRGGLAIGESSVIKMGAKMYGATTLGPHCKVGGEVSNSILMGYSNKGHDGYLGNSVLGEWCNLGADTNNSNLKNNYDEVKVWDYTTGRFARSGQQFVGLLMGDHSKAGINTMFNTGTVVGVSANVYGAGFPRNFIPSYSWGGASGTMVYKLDKAFDTMQRMMSRRGLELTDELRAMYEKVFDLTEGYRR